MNEKQWHALVLRETDVNGAIRRCSGNEALYVQCLIQFLDDPTMEQLNSAIKNRLWDDAFTAAHALKGLAGNMGFIPLMHSLSRLVVMIRGGRTNDVDECMSFVNSHYRNITDAIKENFLLEDAEGEVNESR